MTTTAKTKATPKVMRFVDQDHFECKVCGTTVPLSNIMLQGGGKFPRGTWQCPHGCRLEEKKGGRT